MQFINVSLYKNDDLLKKNENIKATYNEQNNTISYKDEVLTKIILNKDNLIFKRSNDEYEFILKIHNKKHNCTYKLKQENIIFDIKVYNASYKINDNQIEIKYKIETDEAQNKIIIVKN